MTNNQLIVHIPDEPPHDLHHQPTVSVFASSINPKHANQIVRRLNQIAPLEGLRHVKRIRKKLLEGGQIQLSVVLCLAYEGDNQLDGLPPHLQEFIGSYQSANMKQHQKRSGKSNASFGQHHITQELTTSTALLDLARRTHNQY
jgi:hypothetical protein